MGVGRGEWRVSSLGRLGYITLDDELFSEERGGKISPPLPSHLARYMTYPFSSGSPYVEKPDQSRLVVPGYRTG